MPVSKEECPIAWIGSIVLQISGVSQKHQRRVSGLVAPLLTLSYTGQDGNIERYLVRNTVLCCAVQHIVD